MPGAAAGSYGHSALQALGPYLASEQMNDLKSVLDDAHGHQLLAVVAAVHHHGVGEALHDGALRLAEALGCVAPRAVGQVLGVLLLHCDVILGQQEGHGDLRQEHHLG